MKLKEFFLGRDKQASKVESSSASTSDELTLDLSILQGHQERALREDLQSLNSSRRALGGEDISFQSFIRGLVVARLSLLNLNFEVKERPKLLYLETPRANMVFLESEVLRLMLGWENLANSPEHRNYQLFRSPLELRYSGSANYLIIVREVYAWGIRADTPKGPRSFTWEKIEGANCSVPLRKLPFDSTYRVRETTKGFDVRWSLEKY